MKLSVRHPYYASDINYYSNEPCKTHACFSDWYEEFKDADIDMNLIIRFDVYEEDEDNEFGSCYAQITIIHQRKGIYAAHLINSFDEEDEKLLIPLLQRHWQRIKDNWEPISSIDHENEYSREEGDI